MSQHNRSHQIQKTGEEHDNQLLQARCVLTENSKKSKRRFFPSLFILSLITCSLALTSRYSDNLLLYYRSKGNLMLNNLAAVSDCLHCDRTGYRSDVCYMRGDIRSHPPSSSILLYSTDSAVSEISNNQIEKIRPYTRKWETSIMSTVEELKLVRKHGGEGMRLACDVQHSVPAVFFSTGGYTGNVYHEFNDGIIPLYITSRKFNRQVLFIIQEYHNWWITKYGDILSLLSAHAPIDFTANNSVHCVPEAIVGLKIHDELSVDPALSPENRSIGDFRMLLDAAYRPRIRSMIRRERDREEQEMENQKPKLVIISRNESRIITNEVQVVELAEAIGFQVEVVKPRRTTELAMLYRVLNATDVMVGVHGAAMTHVLFLRPGAVVVQVVPLGTEWAAQKYYGEPAAKMGLKYVGYKIQPRESSLYQEYEHDHPVLRNPRSLTMHGWEVTKRLYLDKQNVELNLARFKKRLGPIYAYCRIRRRRGLF